MTHMAGLSDREAGFLVKIAYFSARCQVAKLTGRKTARMIEPLEVSENYAKIP